MKKVAFLICSGIGYLIGHYMGPGALAAYTSILVSYHLYLAFLVVTAEKETGFSLPIGQTIVTHAACLVLVVGIAIGRHYIPFFAIIRIFVPAIAPFEATWLFSGRKKKQENVENQLAAAVAGVPLAPAAVPVIAPVITQSPSPVLAAATMPTAPPAPAAAPAAPAPALVSTVAGVPVAGYAITNSFSSASGHSATSAAGMSVSYSSTSYESDSSGDDYEDFIVHMKSGKRPFRKPGVTVKQEFEAWLAHRTRTRQAQAAASVKNQTKAPAQAKAQA